MSNANGTGGGGGGWADNRLAQQRVRAPRSAAEWAARSALATMTIRGGSGGSPAGQFLFRRRRGGDREFRHDQDADQPWDNPRRRRRLKQLRLFCGAGGAGIVNSGTIATLTNSGTISGGDGGSGGTAGLGGAGLSNFGTVTSLANSGAISGGNACFKAAGGAGVSNSGAISR